MFLNLMYGCIWWGVSMNKGENKSKDVYKYGVNVREFNEQHWEFVRDLSKEEKELQGYKSVSQPIGLYECKHCNTQKVRSKSVFEKALFICPNECNGVKHHTTIVLKGVNDIATTHPHLVKYLLNENDKHRFTANSERKIKIKCLNCGEVKERTLSALTQEGVACAVCSDGISFPEKFIINLLRHLGVAYQKEKSFNNSRKRYDFYIPKLNMIIEAHGEQHYRSVFKNRTVEEEQKNDKDKRDFAMQNGIEHYIELDCRESTLAWIKNSIMNSCLPQLLKFNEEGVDWVDIVEKSSNSLFKEVCDYHKLEGGSVGEIADIFELASSTVTKYLKEGTKLGWCDYGSGEKKQARRIKTSKPVMGINKETGENFSFVSVGQAMLWILETTIGKPKRYNKSNSISYYITKCAKGEMESAYGYTWHYIE